MRDSQRKEMEFARRLRSGEFAVALEITPPQRSLPGVLSQRARLLGDHAHAINVISRPDRQPSLEASCALLESGIEPVWHLVTRGRSRGDVAADIVAAGAGGVRQVLCIRGDHGGGDDAGIDSPTLRETVAMVAEGMRGALIGATFNQYAADGAAALRNLMPKLRAGAEYAQTQPVFELSHLLERVEAVHEKAPETKIVAMAMPLLSLQAAERIEKRVGVTMPARVLERIAAGEEAAWELFEENLAGLAASSAIAGVAIMTFEMSPPAEMGARIRACLDRVAGLGRSSA
ncbi:MAG TPA: methylenetetrahydrofolate reductase [Tepidiformaceae bacterium]|nr:methylenetetrahydrofolate reductase [Tepidiformaceae bacterium]